MVIFKKHIFIHLIVLLLLLSLANFQVTWTDLPELRMGNLYFISGQTSIFDDVYIPLNQNSQVDVTYKTAFAIANPIVHKAIVFSGF